MNRLVFLLLLPFAFCNPSLGQCDYLYLESKIKERIANDISDKDTSFYLFNIKTGDKIKKWKGDQYNDTASFIFRKDCSLRFYLITNGLGNNQSVLKLLHNNSSSDVKPGIILKEVENGMKADDIKVFDYFLKETENLILVLNQQVGTDGCSFAVAIQYRKK
mgnify:CR=1 FL=1